MVIDLLLKLNEYADVHIMMQKYNSLSIKDRKNQQQECHCSISRKYI